MKRSRRMGHIGVGAAIRLYPGDGEFQLPERKVLQKLLQDESCAGAIGAQLDQLVAEQLLVVVRWLVVGVRV